MKRDVPKSGFLALVGLFLAVTYQPAAACLRSSLDDRAVEWSSLIVTAKLLKVGDKSPMPAANPTGASTQASSRGSDAPAFQNFTFEVVSVLDGKAAVGDHVPVIRFFVGDNDDSICGQVLARPQIGKSFLLLLRPEADLQWSGDGSPDPRTAKVHRTKSFAVVHLDALDDLGKEGFADAQYTVTTTRQAEAQFKADDARTQAQTVLSAADDTEEGQAEDALREMGPKASDVLKDEISKADEVGKTRLTKVLAAISPPPITAAMKGP